mmetsp:Transcript_49586/g.124677  ORF Transcript_49586/g.124677 Transcript_49586/m.124677 type:complete len:254 (+) Transcript_49586:40-801(+)
MKILPDQETREMAFHILLTDHHILSLELVTVEAHLLDNTFNNRMQTSCTNVLDCGIHVGGHDSNFTHGLRTETEVNAFGLEQLHLLTDEVAFRLCQNLVEVILGETLEFDTDRETTLKFGQQIGRLARVEGTRGHKEDLRGVHIAVLGLNGAAFDQRKQVTLHTLRAGIGAVIGRVVYADLVDLVDEHDSVILDRLQRLLGDHVLVEDLVGLLLLEEGTTLGHAHLALLAVGDHATQEVLQRDGCHTGGLEAA